MYIIINGDTHECAILEQTVAGDQPSTLKKSCDTLACYEFEWSRGKYHQLLNQFV